VNWDETRRALRDWTGGQPRAEHLAAQILAAEGFNDIDPVHPFGGRDGGADAFATLEGKPWIMAAYFTREPREFSAIEKKFKGDLDGVDKNGASGIAFVTNQVISRGERETLKVHASGKARIFHLERVATVLDRPEMKSIREKYLGITDPADDIRQVLADHLEKQSSGGESSEPEGEATNTDVSVVEALIVDPLEQIGKVQEAERAHQLADSGEFDESTRLFADIATSLRDRNLDVVAETYAILAGETLAKSGDTEGGAAALISVAKDQISRGSGFASLTVGKAEEALPEDQKWQARALRAKLDFGRDETFALKALEEAVTKSAGRPEHIEYLADLTDLLAFLEDFSRIDELVGDFEDGSSESFDVLRISLNRAEASALARPGSSVEVWDDLITKLDEMNQPIWAGIAWQRKGAHEARVEAVSESEESYRKAISSFARVPDFHEQAADAFYSMQAAALLNAEPFTGPEIRALAYELRGPSRTPAARAERLTYLGMDSRLAGRSIESVGQLTAAYELHRQSGSLQGRTEVARKLSELFTSERNFAEATKWSISAGQIKETVAAASQANMADLAIVLRPGGSRWERAATLAAIEAVGDRLPLEFLREIAPWVMEEASEQATGFISPQPSHQAKLAVSRLLPVLEGEDFSSALALVQEMTGSARIDVKNAAEKALVAVTILGLEDASDGLVQAFIDDPYTSRIDVATVAHFAENNSAVAERIRSEASNAYPVLAALIIANIYPEDSEIEALSEDAAQRIIETQNVKVDEGTVSIGIGSGVTILGIAARRATDSTKAKAIDHLIEILEDSRDHSLNRQDAANALFNLAGSAPEDSARRVVESLARISIGRYEESEVDPFLSFPSMGIRAAALGALARVCEMNPSIDSTPLESAIGLAFQADSDDLVLAGLEALTHVPEIKSPMSQEILMANPNPQVRAAAVRCWALTVDGLPQPQVVDALLDDPSSLVLDSLIVLASKLEDRRLMEQIAKTQAAPIIIVKARKALADMQT